MRPLRVRPAATLDVERATLFYLLEASEAVALRFEEAVQETFRWISENPTSGSPRQALSPKLPGLRVWPVQGFEKHLIFYLFGDEGIDVVRVLHGARDLEEILQLEE